MESMGYPRAGLILAARCTSRPTILITRSIVLERGCWGKIRWSAETKRQRSWNSGSVVGVCRILFVWTPLLESLSLITLLRMDAANRAAGRVYVAEGRSDCVPLKYLNIALEQTMEPKSPSSTYTLTKTTKPSQSTSHSWERKLRKDQTTAISWP